MENKVSCELELRARAKQELKENLHNSALLGCLATGIMFSIGTPLTYENQILTFGHFVLILILIGLFTYKFMELRHWYKKQ